MPVQSSNIVEENISRGKKRIIFTLTTNTGKLIGPVIEHRLISEDINDFLQTKINVTNEELKQLEFEALKQYIIAGNSIETFNFNEITVREGSRKLLRYFYNTDDMRQAKNYIQRIVAATTVKISQILGVSTEAANGIKSWAQSVLTSLQLQDDSRANANLAIGEIGE